MCKIKEEAKKATPKRSLELVSSQAGGILQATSAGALPRKRQQVKDAWRKYTDKQSYDTLYAVMHMRKEAEGKGEGKFLTMLNAAPYPTMMIAWDYSLDDLVQFCTNPQKFSIFGVDPTFNLGDFDVTVNTYRHLLLEPCGSPSGNPPTVLSPMFVHVRKDFEAYHFFASTLVGQRRELCGIQAFGTDGEQALENGQASPFQSTQHVRCFLHFQDNVQRKLHELGLPFAVWEKIVKDVLGIPGPLQRGLVDAADEDQLDGMLSRLSSRWNTLEVAYSRLFFHTWFVKHCRDVVALFMLRSVWEKAGLGSPPTPYYTNEVKSKNRVLKEEVSYKSPQLPDFIQKMKSVFEQQKSEIKRAVVNTGEYRLRAEYRHLSVESSKWFILSREQRKRKIERFVRAPLAEDTPSTSRSGMNNCDGLQDFPILSHLGMNNCNGLQDFPILSHLRELTYMGQSEQAC